MVIRPQKWNFNPRQHQSGCLFAKQCQINGYDAIVTVEDFAEHELKTIDAVTAKKQAYCNLFQTLSGQIGIFDFNRCGDNNLFCDAVMQAVFEARLMDYPDGAGDEIRPEILSAFLRGYRSIRDFPEEQQTWYLYLYAIINAFCSADIRWSSDSLTNAVKRGDMRRAKKWLESIWQHLAIK